MKFVHVYLVPGERWAMVRGRVGRWFQRNRIPAMRSPRNNGYRLWHARVPDVIARLEVDGYAVRFAQHMPPPHIPAEATESDLEVAA